MAETNEPDVALWRGNLQFFARRQQGRVDEAVEALLPLLSEGILEFLPPAAIDAASGLVGMALAEAGRLDEARPHLEAQLAGAPALLRNSVWLAMVGALGVAAAELEAPEAAWFRAELEPFAARWACWGFLGTVGPVASIVGRLDLALGDLAAADRWFDDAIARCRVDEAPYFLAEALLHRGRARITAGDAEAAGPSLREALALAGAGGYGLIARRATDALGAS
jgi:tetratricopeptide (TPR) repeat protein